MYKFFFKPILDFLVALLALIVALPLLLGIILLLYFFNKRSVFFVQPRPGKNGIIFKLIKFKTMTDERGVDGKLLPDGLRLTKIGKFVRSTSLDELPQLLNVLKGDMSLIGPRPLLVGYLELYTDFQKRRHDVKPGITGWAQVNGRNALSWEQKFEYDVWYVAHLSFWLDLKILGLTIKKVLVRDGINMEGTATAQLFKGTQE
jgi:undecaprenyl phosphate N,N'-diacetylbacillosamine 1-phosphate transferase